jgi:hypothetical protein
MPPALPWAGLASRAPRPTVMAGRSPADGPECGPAVGIVVVATSLLRERLGTPSEPAAGSQGIASTAVSPFYLEEAWSTRSVIGIPPNET